MNDIENPFDIARYFFSDLNNAIYTREAELRELGYSDEQVKEITDKAKRMIVNKISEEWNLTGLDFVFDPNPPKQEPRICDDEFVKNLSLD